jgi:hypothetical protein
MTPEQIEAARPAFEAFASTLDLGVSRAGLGFYSDYSTYYAWAGWLAAKADAVPDGWQLVPVEPTEEMLNVGQHTSSEWLNDIAPIGETRYRTPAKHAYRNMLAAAPIPRGLPTEEAQSRREALLDEYRTGTDSPPK